MNSISKTILLSAVSLFVDNGNLTYASEQIPLSVPKSGIHTLHTHHTHIRHTLQGLDLSSRLFDKKMNKGVQIASVCFITDTRNCSEDRFGNLESPNGGNGGGGKPDDHGTPEELCKQAGYTNTPCPEGSKPSSYCPYDSSYHSACQCLSEYNKTCDMALGEKGVGVACNGKYKECCSSCEGYDYTSIPSGYVSNGECQSCNGKKYKIKCDPQKYVSGSSCGTQGGSGSTCSDDFGTSYAQCNCPNNYEWSSSQKKCVCATSFKYSCSGTGYSGGNGTACNGKYSRCNCANGFTWNASQGACVCSGFDFCTLSQDCSALGYAQQSCEGKSVKCPFNTNYVYCLD